MTCECSTGGPCDLPYPHGATTVGDTGLRLVRLCAGECGGLNDAEYLADLGGYAPGWRGESFPLCTPCAVDYRATPGMVRSIRSVRPDEALAAAFTVADFRVESAP